MSLIKPKTVTKKEAVRVKIDSTILQDINRYCAYAGFEKIDDFLAEAAQYVLSKDRDYAEHVKVEQVVR